MNSFFFYDIETSGLNKAFDQVLQFAAIRTDPSFKEIERRSLAIRLRPDIIPSPGAFLTHRIGLDRLKEGSCELDATIRIHRWMNQPGTVSIGYNSLGFDDEFLRFAFYRNLLPPYTHQFQNGCRRMDLLPMTVLFHLYGPEGIQWPRIDGKPSLKLEHISSANQLSQGPAHDAMADVEATLALAQRFFQSGAMWQYLAQAFDKTEDTRRIDKLPEGLPGESGPHRLGILAASEFGADNHYQVPALHLGRSIPYSNQTLWLRLDLENLADTTAETVEETTWVVRKKLGEGPVVLPPRERFWQQLGKTRGRLAKANIGWLKGEPDLLQRIAVFNQQYRYPEIPDLDPDAALYQDGFFSRKEETWCRQFHSVLPGERPGLLSQTPSERINRLASRILLRNNPDAAQGDMAKSYAAYMRHVNPPSETEAMVDYRSRHRTTPRSALAEIAALKADGDLSRESLDIIDSLRRYIIASFPITEDADF
ncbi:MAG: exodeoxyribonuclease I [Desulfobacterales bacterium]|nr:exodeoxyribonuclease I [Desulfobacterales bacterium]